MIARTSPQAVAPQELQGSVLPAQMEGARTSRRPVLACRHPPQLSCAPHMGANTAFLHSTAPAATRLLHRPLISPETHPLATFSAPGEVPRARGEAFPSQQAGLCGHLCMATGSPGQVPKTGAEPRRAPQALPRLPQYCAGGPASDTVTSTHHRHNSTMEYLECSEMVPSHPVARIDNNNTQSIADYLAQLLKDKKQLAAFPNVFIHMERLLDDGKCQVKRCEDV